MQISRKSSEVYVQEVFVLVSCGTYKMLVIWWDVSANNDEDFQLKQKTPSGQKIQYASKSGITVSKFYQVLKNKLKMVLIEQVHPVTKIEMKSNNTVYAMHFDYLCLVQNNKFLTSLLLKKRETLIVAFPHFLAFIVPSDLFLGDTMSLWYLYFRTTQPPRLSVCYSWQFEIIVVLTRNTIIYDTFNFISNQAKPLMPVICTKARQFLCRQARPLKNARELKSFDVRFRVEQRKYQSILPGRQPSIDNQMQNTFAIILLSCRSTQLEPPFFLHSYNIIAMLVYLVAIRSTAFAKNFDHTSAMQPLIIRYKSQTS